MTIETKAKLDKCSPSRQPDREKNLIAMMRLMVRDGAAEGILQSLKETCAIKREWLDLKRDMSGFEITKCLLRKHLKDNRMRAKQAENGSPESASARIFPEGIKMCYANQMGVGVSATKDDAYCVLRIACFAGGNANIGHSTGCTGNSRELAITRNSKIPLDKPAIAIYSARSFVIN